MLDVVRLRSTEGVQNWMHVQLGNSNRAGSDTGVRDLRQCRSLTENCDRYWLLRGAPTQVVNVHVMAGKSKSGQSCAFVECPSRRLCRHYHPKPRTSLSISCQVCTQLHAVARYSNTTEAETAARSSDGRLQHRLFQPPDCA